jgi:hypothetical protein
MSPSKVMGYWSSWPDDNLAFYFCPEGFRPGIMKIWKTVKASLTCKELLIANPQAPLRE